MLWRGLSLLLACGVFIATLFSASTSNAQAVGWWQSVWNYQIPLTVKNNSTSVVVPHYSVKALINTSALISTQQMLSNCADLRVVYYDGTNFTELDRVVNACNSTQTEVWFAAQRSIAGGGTDTGYYLYYGNSAAGAPPSNGVNVFVFYEDWENGAAHWVNAGGLDASASGTMGTTQVSTDSAVSGIYSQKFPVKTYGGDAFSGFIPVNASTRYAVSVWGMSAAPSYLPVGFDPYDASKTKGNETWFWTSAWTLSPQWTQRTANFTTSSTMAYLKLKSEWWGNSTGNSPVYLDNLALRYYLTNEPSVSLGAVVSRLPTPTVTNVTATSPVTLGAATTVSASANSNGGASITQLVLQILTPQTTNVNMSLVSGDGTSGNWQAQFTPAEGGTYTYNVAAYSGSQIVAQSGNQTFSVIDTQPPVLTLQRILDPIQANSLQTLVVEATDNGAVATVTVTLNGFSYPMTANGNSYSYSWRVINVGTVPYQVVATDTAGNSTSLSGSFTVQAQQVGVCTWYGCKQGAESFSVDDTINSCRTEMETAGFRGTYYVIGTAPQAWFFDYSAAGHEIAAHTVDHPCVAPCCSPNCTPQSLAACPYANTDVTNYQLSELEPNIAMIETSTQKPARSLAWPCGCVDPGHEKAASAYFLGARGFYDSTANLTWVKAVNTAEPADYFNLWSALDVQYNNSVYDPTPIDLAASQGGWAIVATHGDCTEIPYMGQMTSVLWAAPIGDVLKYIKVRDAASFTNYSRTAQAITFDAGHNLPTFQRQKLDGTYFLPIVFDNAVTLMASLQNGDAVSSVLVDGTSVPFAFTTSNGARYVTFDASLLNSRHVTISLTPDFSLSMQPSAETVTAGNSASLTITSSAFGGYSGSPTLSVSGLPADTTYSFSNTSITPPQSATLTLTTATDTPAGSYPVTVSAGDGTLTHTASTVLTIAPPLLVQSITVSPNAVFGGGSATATVTLTGVAPTGGTTLSVSSDNTAASVPATLTVPAGASSATFTITTSTVTSQSTANISVLLGGASRSAALSIQPLLVQSVSLNPISVFGGANSTGTVTLNGAAPAATVVALTSGNAAASVPANVTVAARATTAIFAVTTTTVSSSTAATISAQLNGSSQSATLTVQPLLVQSISLNPTSLIGGGTITATVTLNGAAPTPATVGISSSSAAATVPTSVTVPSGASNATFTISTAVVTSVTTASISAQLGTSSQSATLTIQPLVVQSIALNPTTVQGGAAAAATVTLNGAAPSPGAVVSLSSSSASAIVPPTVTVPTGASSATFSVSTSTVTSLTSATVSAQLNGSLQSATLAILPPPNSAWWQPQWLYRLPLTVTNNSTSALASRYSVKYVLDTSALITPQQLLSNCADLRVVFFDGTNYSELDRVVNSCNSIQTEVWFALQRSVAASATETAYYLYYDNPLAGAAPGNGMNVFLFYEDWENGPTHWINAGGLDTSAGGTMGTTQISTDYAVSGTHSQEFMVKAYGGDAFSGFIPVTPSTRYAISVRGMSATAAYMPVGFDPYNSTKTKGAEVWFWTSAWSLTPQWVQRSATFTTNSTTTFLKLKSEWWGEGPGTAPVYLDDLVLRLSVSSEPTVTAGASQSAPN